MEPKLFWERYAAGQTPAEFMSRYQSRNPIRCAERYVSRLPQVYGLFRERTWRATFKQSFPPVRDEIVVGLSAYLEETRAEWEAALAEKAEREQTEWEQTERERMEREQAEWERTQIPQTAPEPPLDLSQLDVPIEELPVIVVDPETTLSAQEEDLIESAHVVVTDVVFAAEAPAAETEPTVILPAMDAESAPETMEPEYNNSEETSPPLQETPPEPAVDEMHAEQTTSSGTAS